MTNQSSTLAGAVVVAPGEIDEGLISHYGDPFAEQRRWLEGIGTVELSNRRIITVTGPERLSYLHALTTQHLLGMQSGQSALTLNLSPQGFVMHEMHLIDDGATLWLIVESATAEELLDYLRKMRFRMELDVADVSQSFTVIAQPQQQPHEHFPTFVSPFATMGRELIVPNADALEIIRHAPCGVWAFNAVRIAAGAPRQDVETDHHTIPLEVQWYPAAVHLDKGCYRGQETISKVARMGKPPRRQTLLHFDGSSDTLPAHGTEVQLDDVSVGFIGQSIQHCELGPIASALIKRSVPLDAILSVAGLRASQESVSGE